jgi:L-asparaginase
MPKRKRVYVAHAGGTVGMRRTARGWAPERGFLEPLLRALPEMAHESIPEIAFHEYDPLLDSSNMTPADWQSIGDDIARQYDDFDGFVVLHGTDTMAYTSAALSFMLKHLGKPIVVTGSQIPLCEVRNDARRNLVDALFVACDDALPEVCLVFGGKILRGNRAVKVSAESLDAFDSPNYPLLGRAGTRIEIYREHVRPMPTERLTVRRSGRANVAALRLFPGIAAPVVANILQSPIQGLVLECYGVGNAPDRDAAFIQALSEATARGVVVVVVSQCLEGVVELGDYAAGSALARAGCIGARDMTTEAAMAKMFHLLKQDLPPDEVKAKMGVDFRGELTPAAGRAS